MTAQRVTVLVCLNGGPPTEVMTVTVDDLTTWPAQLGHALHELADQVRECAEDAQAGLVINLPWEDPQ